MQKLKPFIAIFTLLVFLFPLAEKGIHDYHHINDKHCASVDKHLHTSEHHCEICDFTNNINGLPSYNEANLLLSETAVLDFYFPENILLILQKHFHSLRAPPSLV